MIGAKALLAILTILGAVTPAGPRPAEPRPLVVGVDLAAPAGIYESTHSWSANVDDFNGDGRADFLLSRHQEHRARLYRNDGGHFTEVDAGTFPVEDRHDCAWADVNQDGLDDAYCSIGADQGAGTGNNELWMQQPDGGFVNEAATYGVQDPYGRSRRVSFLDVNHDQYPDLFEGNDYPRVDGIKSPNRLWINVGGISYRDAAEYGLEYEVGGDCAEAVDFDNDGWQDLLVCGNERLLLYRNVDGIRFEDATSAIGISGWWFGAILVDLNHDAAPDLVEVNTTTVQIQYQHAGLFQPPVEVRPLVSGRKVAAGDVNGDGWLDLYVVQGCLQDRVNRPDLLLLANGDGTFDENGSISQPTAGCGDDVSTIDGDGDGRSEFIVLNGEGGGLNIDGPVQLLHFFDCTIAGSDGPDELTGTPGDDVLCGLGGSDDIRSLTGNDVLLGGPGDDVIRGGRGGDLLAGGPGADSLSGAGGPDTLVAIDGVARNDRLFGGPGTDGCSADRDDVLTGCQSHTLDPPIPSASGPFQEDAPWVGSLAASWNSSSPPTHSPSSAA